MTSFRVRPRFKQISPLPIDTLVKQLNEKLESCPTCVEGMVFKTHGLFRIKPEEQHFWSPQLTISFEETPDGTIIRGMYGPHPTVWSIFTFGYAVLGLAFFFISIIGFVRLSLGLSHGILWVLPVIIVLLIILYIMSQVGQKVGAEQTFALHHFYEDAIGEKVHVN